MLFIISPLHHVAVSVAIGTLDLAISTHTSDSSMHAHDGPNLHSSHSKSTSAKSHTTQQLTPEDCILSGDPFLDLFQTFWLCFYHSILRHMYLHNVATLYKVSHCMHLKSHPVLFLSSVCTILSSFKVFAHLCSLLDSLVLAITIDFVNELTNSLTWPAHELACQLPLIAHT